MTSFLLIRSQKRSLGDSVEACMFLLGINAVLSRYCSPPVVGGQCATPELANTATCGHRRSQDFLGALIGLARIFWVHS